MGSETLKQFEGISFRVPCSREKEIESLFLELGIENYRMAPIYELHDNEYLQEGYAVELITHSKAHNAHVASATIEQLVSGREQIYIRETTFSEHKVTLSSLAENMSLDQPMQDLVECEEITLPPYISDN